MLAALQRPPHVVLLVLAHQVHHAPVLVLEAVLVAPGHRSLQSLRLGPPVDGVLARNCQLQVLLPLPRVSSRLP